MIPKPRARPNRTPDDPRFAHHNGQDAKKVRGKLLFFGVWRDADAAMAKWLLEKDFLPAWRRAPALLTGPTVDRNPTAEFAEISRHLSDRDAGTKFPRVA